MAGGLGFDLQHHQKKKFFLNTRLKSPLLAHNNPWVCLTLTNALWEVTCCSHRVLYKRKQGTEEYLHQSLSLMGETVASYAESECFLSDCLKDMNLNSPLKHWVIFLILHIISSQHNPCLSPCWCHSIWKQIAYPWAHSRTLVLQRSCISQGSQTHP